VLRLNPDLRIAFINGAAGHLIGVDARSAPGRPIREILPLPLIGNPWAPDLCASGAASFEQPARNRAGAAVWLWWDVRWLGDDDGPAEFQAVGRDITESRRLRAQIERAREEAQFAALAVERLRIAHDLHDTLIHSIVNLMARLTLLRRASPAGPLRDDLAAAEAEARDGLREAREAVGAIRGGFDLPEAAAPAIEAAAEQLRTRAGMRVALDLGDDLAGLSAQQGAAALRIVREALRNIALHSGARHVAISTRLENRRRILAVADDGIGFDPPAARPGHYGLKGMDEQSRLAGGALTIESAPGEGARVTLTFPAG
jgi:signal transduction histidine kinase